MISGISSALRDKASQPPLERLVSVKSGTDTSYQVIKEFQDALRGDPNLAIAAAAIKALAGVISNSTATTVHGLQKELEAASASLQKQDRSISLRAACELFLELVRKTTVTVTDKSDSFEKIKSKLITRGSDFTNTSIAARAHIARTGFNLISNNSTILTNGYSRCVIEMLAYAAKKGKRFTVVVAFGLDEVSADTIRKLQSLNIHVAWIPEGSVGTFMESADMVLLGAEAITEDGGLINKVGTCTLCHSAHIFKKKVYVAAESYKFVRLYPRRQRDVPFSPMHLSVMGTLPPNVEQLVSSRDYTSPEFINLLITDLGPMLPTAVNAEIINMFE